MIALIRVAYRVVGYHIRVLLMVRPLSFLMPPPPPSSSLLLYR